MNERASSSEEGLAGELERLRDQRRAIGEVLRAVARGEGLQPVLDEIVAAAQSLCEAEHGQLYLREGDVFHIASESGGQLAAFEYDREHAH